MASMMPLPYQDTVALSEDTREWVVAPRSSGGRRSAQLLMRLTPDEFEVLDAAAHLEKATPNAYAYGLLRGHIEGLRSNPFVMRAIALRVEYQTQHATVRRMEVQTRPAKSEVADADETDHISTSGADT